MHVTQNCMKNKPSSMILFKCDKTRPSASRFFNFPTLYISTSFLSVKMSFLFNIK